MNIYLDIVSPASKEAGILASDYGLQNHGLVNLRRVYWNLSTAALYEEIVFRSEGTPTHLGPVLVNTGKHTARAAADKFVVREQSTEDRVWWGTYNRPFTGENFSSLLTRVQGYLQGRDVFVQDCYAGADPEYSLPIRIITQKAWHSLFSRTMFLKPRNQDNLKKHVPEFTVIAVPGFLASPMVDGTRSGTFININFCERLAIIGGTSYAGEIKKTIFTVLNFLLPLQSVLSMHCSANVGAGGDVAIFFGLSGTGKTTLSADPNRRLIGDDEHGCSDNGVFNFEDGCYAKVIKLSQETEPMIWDATNRFGAVLENVVFDPVTRIPDYDDGSKTENTRSAYPMEFIPNASRSGRAGHPKNIIFLTADAFGVMPPIAKLDPNQAMYHFLSGYTAKVAGTEKGLVGVEPEFSTCFGAPFLPRHPSVYADLLRDYINKHKVDCWLVNSGWTGGKYGEGRRMPIKATRTLLTAALNGSLKDADFRTDPYFGFSVPTSVHGVEPHLLNPFKTWKDKAAFDKTARALVGMFQKNFTKFESHVTPDIKAAAPEVRIAAE